MYKDVFDEIAEIPYRYMLKEALFDWYKNVIKYNYDKKQYLGLAVTTVTAPAMIPFSALEMASIKFNRKRGRI